MLAFHEFIAEGERRGYGRQCAAERLLQGIRKPKARCRVLGLRKVAHLIIPTLDEERSRFQAETRMDVIRRELDAPTVPARRRKLQDEFRRLAPLCEARERWDTVHFDLAPSLVPPAIWTYFNDVETDITSQWQDDDEQPSEWARVDWIAGTIETFENDFFGDDVHVAGVNVEYKGLQITPTAANELLSYSDEELIAIITTWPGNDGTRLWDKLKHDPKLGLHNQDQVRTLWKARRNPSGKRGPKGSK